MIDYKDINKKPDSKKQKPLSIKTILGVFTLLVFIVFVLLSIYFYTLYTQKHYVLKYVAISGNHILNAEKIKSITLTNKATCINNQDEEKIYSWLIINPWIKRAYVAKIYPDTIYIKILERKPCGVVQSKDGMFIVDCQGDVIDKYKKELTIDIKQLPLILSDKKEYIQKQFLMNAVLGVYRKLDKLGKINYIEIISDSRQVVHFANALNIEVDSLHCPYKAFKHLEKQWNNLVKKRKKLKSVSICFLDKFVLSWKKGKKNE